MSATSDLHQLKLQGRKQILSTQPASPTATPNALPGRPNTAGSSPLFPGTLPSSFIQQIFIEHLQYAKSQALEMHQLTKQTENGGGQGGDSS